MFKLSASLVNFWGMSENTSSVLRKGLKKIIIIYETFKKSSFLKFIYFLDFSHVCDEITVVHCASWLQSCKDTQYNEKKISLVCTKKLVLHTYCAIELLFQISVLI